MSLTGSVVEDAALEWFGELDYAAVHDPFHWCDPFFLLVLSAALVSKEIIHTTEPSQQLASQRQPDPAYSRSLNQVAGGVAL
jgi:hypothetical protein